MSPVISAHILLTKARHKPKPIWMGWESELLPQSWRRREEGSLMMDNSICHHVTNQSCNASCLLCSFLLFLHCPGLFAFNSASPQLPFYSLLCIAGDRPGDRCLRISIFMWFQVRSSQRQGKQVHFKDKKAREATIIIIIIITNIITIIIIIIDSSCT